LEARFDPRLDAQPGVFSFPRRTNPGQKRPMPSLRIVTWNINSVRLRLPLLRKLTRDHQPDVVCLQEIKVADGSFPSNPIRRLGYDQIATNGQKGYPGGAMLPRLRLSRIDAREFCKKGDARHLSVTLPGGIELHNFYVPAGGDIPDPKANDKFRHKLRFLDE